MIYPSHVPRFQLVTFFSIALSLGYERLQAETAVYEPFEYAAESTIVLKDGGTGFAGAWGPRSTLIGSGSGLASPEDAFIRPESLTYSDGERTLVTQGGSLYLTGENSNVQIAREVDLQALPNPGVEPEDGTTTYLSFLAHRQGEAADPADPVYSGSYPYGENLYPRSAGIGLLSWNDGEEGSDLLQLFVGNLSNRTDDVWRFTGEDYYGDERRDARSDAPFGGAEQTQLVVMRIDHGGGTWHTDRVKIWIDPLLAQERANQAPITFDWTSRDDPLNLQPTFIALEANDGNSLRPHAELAFDELRIGASWEDVTPYTGGSEWAGRPVIGDRVASGQGFLGWLLLSDSDWVFSWSLNTWLYIPPLAIDEAGAWMFLTRTGLEAPERAERPSVLLAYEGFDYEAGQDLIGDALAGGSGWAGAWAAVDVTEENLAEVKADSLGYTDGSGDALETSGGHTWVAGATDLNTSVRRTLENPVEAAPGNTVYLSFVGQRTGEAVDLENPLWSDTSIYPNGYPWGDNLYPRNAGVNLFTEPSGSDTSAQIGNLSDQLTNLWSLNSESTHFISDTPFTEKAFVVVRLDYTAHQEVDMRGNVSDVVGTTATVWVNPTDLVLEDASDAMRQVVYRDLVTPYAVAMEGLGLAAGNDSYNRPPAEFLVDELRVGTGWDAVTPVIGGKPTVEEPEPRYWAGMEIVDGYIWAGSELGWLWAESAPWLYNFELEAWMWCEESWMTSDSQWIYVPDAAQ